MVMSTPILAEASNLMASALLIDTVQVYLVGTPVTDGYTVTRSTLATGEPIPGLVQTTVLANAVESNVINFYSIKVAQGTVLQPGMAVKVLNCVQEPVLNGKMLLVDKVSENGLSMIRKAVASDFDVVNQEGKEALQ